MANQANMEVCFIFLYLFTFSFAGGRDANGIGYVRYDVVPFVHDFIVEDE